MDPDDIRKRVARIDNRDVAASDAAWAELRPLGAAVVPYLLEAYRRARRAEARIALVFHAIPFARHSDASFDLGVAALADRSTLVRYRGCCVLAYSLRHDAVPHLQSLLAHADARTIEDARAALDAIAHRNHHYFVDRSHTGQMFWEVPDPSS